MVTRIVISAAAKNQEQVESLCKKYTVQCANMGVVRGDTLTINDYIDIPITELKDLYNQAIPKAVETA